MSFVSQFFKDVISAARFLKVILKKTEQTWLDLDSIYLKHVQAMQDVQNLQLKKKKKIDSR